MNDGEGEQPPQVEAGDPEARARLGRFWAEQIKASEKEGEKFRRCGDKIIKRYKEADRPEEDKSRRFNILHSNTETVLPSIYNQTPKPVAQRTNKDKDPKARIGAMLLERALVACSDLYDVDTVFEGVVKDLLLPGRGQAWVRYEPIIVQGMKVDEKVYLEYVPWKDYLESSGSRYEAETWWKARRDYLTREELVAQFGEEIGRAVKLDHAPEGANAEFKDKAAKARVWQIWDRRSRKVLWVAPGSESAGLLKEMPPPLNFVGFFPCPSALTATTAGDDMMPVADYIIYQDQADELDTLTERIGYLQHALRVAGVYNGGGPGEIQRLVEEKGGNRLVPVDNWAAFSEGGGLKGNIEFLPIKDIADALIALYQARDQVKNDLYEVSGIADIMRGSTDSDETATAQSIKANWGTRRVRRRQKLMQRFIRDCYRLKAEVMAEQFDFETLVRLAGLDPADPVITQYRAQIEPLLKNEQARLYRIDIETDSTIEPDQAEDQKQRVEFLTAVTTFLKEGGAIAAQSPALGKLMGELLLFGVRGFPKGAQMEEPIEEALNAFAQEQQMKAQQGPPPDPKVAEVQAGIKRDDARFQHETQMDEREQQREEKKLVVDTVLKVNQAEAKAMVDEARANGAGAGG